MDSFLLCHEHFRHITSARLEKSYPNITARLHPRIILQVDLVQGSLLL